MKILGKIVLGIGGMSCLGYLLRKSEDKLMEEKEKKDKEYTDAVTENATYLDAMRQMEKEKKQDPFFDAKFDDNPEDDLPF